MLRSVKETFGYDILATDGAIGSVHDFLFDDSTWVLRYLVVDTGEWLPGRLVLLSPVALGQPQWEGRVLPVSLSREQVRNSPDIRSDKPVSRQYEADLHRYYAWPVYWGGADMAGPPSVGVPPGLAEQSAEAQAQGGGLQAQAPGDPHLRSSKEVAGYDIQARDGAIGHVDDFIADFEAWVIRYLVVDTRNWLPGKKVLLAPDWVRSITWRNASVAVDVERAQVKGSPEYRPEALTREYEATLYDWYGRPKYW